MNVIICGAGDVGRHLSEVLCGQGHGVTIIDVSAKALSSCEDLVDVRAIRGSSAHAATLSDAGVAKCDLLVAATDQDEINLLSAVVAKNMGAARVIARIHHRAYLDRRTLDYAQQLNIDHLICPEHLTAMVVARTLSDPSAVAIERFARDQIEVLQYAVQEKSPAVGVVLSELQLPRGIRLALIQRDAQVFIPQADSVLRPGDVVTAVSETRHFAKVRQVLQERAVTMSNIAIMGGTAMAVWLCRALRGRQFSLRLFETHRPRAEELSEKLSHVTVLQADPTDPVVFAEEHLEACSAFVAVSKDDEHNILGALQARELGVATTVVVIAHPTYLQLLEHVGIDHPFSPRIVAAKEVLRLIDESPVRRCATISDGVAEVYEIPRVGHGTGVGKPLREVRLPQGAFVAAVQRGEQATVPGADSVVQAGDGLIIIGPASIEKQIRQLFIGK